MELLRNFPAAPGWQLTLIAFDAFVLCGFLYLLIKKVTSKNPYTHFEGRLYWIALIFLLLNLAFYMYGYF